MFLLSALRFFLLTLGGLAGVFTLLVSYILMLQPEASPQVEDLPPGLQDWYSRGRMVTVLGRSMFVLEQGSGPETLILIHGFPTSSYDYHRVIDKLSQDYRVVVFDHLGFGFSDKPQDISYSLVEQAEQALALWSVLGISRAHVVSHDMGDSVLTEILARVERGMVPDRFQKFFQSITFTNGGMRYHLINMRLSQILLKSPIGGYLTAIGTRNFRGNSDKLGGSQLATIWSPSYIEREVMERDIEEIQVLNKYKGGSALTHKTIGYLHDRARFEPRWMSSLARLELPILLLWGDSDAVAPMAIPMSLRDIIPEERLTFNTISGAGHFLMLEQPENWTRNILKFVQSNSRKES